MSTNGSTPHTRKRKLHSFTFESTGYEVAYRCIPYQRIIDFETEWAADHKPPSVPEPLSDVAGEMRPVPNPSDPDYQQAKVAWDSLLRNTSWHWMFSQALVMSDEDKAEVSEYRTSHPHVQIEDDDAWLFIMRCACADSDELGLFQNRILRLSQPTAEAVADAKARFPDTVQQS